MISVPSNFAFLEKDFSILARLGSLAEDYVYSDTNSCLLKLGQLGEELTKLMMGLDGVTLPADKEDTQINRIKFLQKEDLISSKIEDILHTLRLNRNKAMHQSYYASQEESLTLLRMGYSLATWFMESYSKEGWNYAPAPFVIPENKGKPDDYIAKLQEQEALIAKLMEQTTVVPEKIERADRLKRSKKAANLLDLSEEETRYLIDEQLRAVGWEADTEKLRYSKGTRPEKGRNLAIAEWPTDSKLGDYGRADYAFFVGLKLVGVVEAKKKNTDVSSVIDHQCQDYAQSIKAEHAAYQISNWGKYKVPFIFATNGRKYLKQLETKSGIWFRDLRASDNGSKALQGWMSPQGMMDLLEKDIASANEKLQETPYDLLRDKDGLNLREYQIRAIDAAEKAILDGEKAVLLSMATGTGKTRTVLGMIYRFLTTKRFYRILFLVDRNALGEQAQDVFNEVKLEDLLTLNQICDVKKLEDRDIDRTTKVHVATVQGMVQRVLYNEGDKIPAVTDYDLIVVDEAHRGYVLDKEMSDEELLYRNQDDYISTYRTVIEYFDAVKIALTATPALHTTEIFGAPVFNYGYREAVIEGYLVDHDAPHNIVTQLSKGGITYEKGETVPIYNPITDEIINSAELEDELHFDVEQFNKQVITENFNRTVLQEIARDLNPEGKGKTLIFAVDDNHADMIVKLLKEIYEPQGVDSEAIMKITGSVGGGNRKKVLGAVKKFKNEKYPNIAVTVELLTTGIDVPEITTLVFMRRVKSRILFEQMLGRATRLCPDIGKDHFEIYDAVNIYETLAPVSTMKPVVVNATASLEDLMQGLETLSDEERLKNQVDLIVAKMRRRMRNMDAQVVAGFKEISGGQSAEEFIGALHSMSTAEAVEHVSKNRRLFTFFREGQGNKPGQPIVVSDKEDELISHTRGYGSGVKPEDYLEEFRRFITDNINLLPALNVVCTRPQELTREDLKKLKLELDSRHFTEQQLKSAWKDMTNQEIAADIIGFIRQQALDLPLIPYEERIKNAVRRLVSKHNFSKLERDWLDKIERVLLQEKIMDRQLFEAAAFKNEGGYARVNKAFGNHLDEIIVELNTYLYENEGKTAS